MTFDKKKTEYRTLSLTVTKFDRETLYDEVEQSKERFTSTADFVRSAINFKLEAMGIDFRLG